MNTSNLFLGHRGGKEKNKFRQVDGPCLIADEAENKFQKLVKLSNKKEEEKYLLFSPLRLRRTPSRFHSMNGAGPLPPCREASQLEHRSR
jgi:hypothetical protein